MKRTRQLHAAVTSLAALSLLALRSPPLAAGGPASIVIDAGHPGAAPSPHLWGLFFEEINHAGDGGLYAELVRNRSFEDSDRPEGWAAVGGAKLAIDSERPLNEANRRSLRVETTAAGGGVENEGFWGLPVESGARYVLTLHARAAADSSLLARIESRAGNVLAEARIDSIGSDWKEARLGLTPTGSDARAVLRITAPTAGTFWLDVVSLFPEETWKSRPNGLRKDLAKLLAEIRPSFVRFPGGCYVEGNRLANAFRWKRSIGDIAGRPGHSNSIWGYRSCDGLGYHEYLQMCEDLGSEPLFVINCGMAHEDHVPLGEMDEWIQDALDAIEYANGPETSRWGALRSKNGHPAPFGLKFLEIGNENGGKPYDERYELFRKAILAKHPQMRLIANVPVPSPMDIVDEHYYSSPEWFLANAHKYDRYSRTGPRIYVGEYACTQNCGQGNLRAALGEAAFMTGMERNSDVVVMASYAPLFVNAANRAWNPDAIVFDAARSFGTPSYHVQKLFSENRGDAVLPLKLSTGKRKALALPGAIGLGTWLTEAEYREVKVTEGGRTLLAPDFGKGAEGWRVFKGDWKATDGVYRQTSRADDVRSIAGDPAWRDYTLSLKARKLGGAEGFLVMFRVRDDRNWYWWNIGGWGNSRHAIEKCAGGGKSLLGESVSGKVETDRWYDIRVELEGPRIRCYLDGKLVHDVEDLPGETLAASALRSKSRGEVVLKVVNYSDAIEETAVRVDGCEVAAEGKALVLTSTSPEDENSFVSPLKVAPVEEKAAGLGREFTYRFRPWSLTVLRIPAR